jgi:O-antigen ligase
VNGADNNEQPQDLLQGVARWLVVAAVVVSPWLFGSAEPWAYLLICILANTGTLAWLASVLWLGHARRNTRRMALPIVAMLGYLFLQTAPLPSFLVNAVNPLSAEVQISRDRMLDALRPADTAAADTDTARVAAPAPRAVPRPTLSFSSASTHRSLCLWVAYAGVFLVMTGATFNGKQLRQVASALAVSGFIMAVFAVVQNLSGTGLIYWFHRPRFGGMIFGPFTNRNHFAAQMNMLFGVALALVLGGARQPGREGEETTWREKVARLSDRGLSQTILLGFAAIVIGSATCLSLSRGGITSLAAALGAAGVVVTVRSRTVEKRRSVVTVALLVIAMVVWLGWQPVLERLGSLTILTTDPLRNSRITTTLATLRLWLASPFAGCGFGTFEHVFPLFQIAELQFGRFLHAHNDYAQLLAEGGAIGAALAAWLAVRLARTIRQYLPSAADNRIGFAGGLLVGILAIALHSAVDFSLHKPANSFLLAALCGMALTAVSPSRRTSAPAVKPDRAKRAPVRAAAVLGLALVGFLAYAETRELEGELAFARYLQWQKIAERAPDAATRTAVAGQASRDADWFMLMASRNADGLLEVAIGNLWRVGNRDVTPDLRIQLTRQAEQAALMAVQAAPSDYECWLWLARVQGVLGRKRESKASFTRARVLAPPGMELKLL